MSDQLIHTCAAVLLELVYIASGLILAIIGKRLLEKGITGAFAGEGEVASQRFRIVTSSPGLVFLICGLAIIISAVFTQAKFTQKPEKEDAVSLADLAETVTSSVLAQSSPEARFALDQYETSLRVARGGDTRLAVTYLARAVVIKPDLLRRALDSADLEEVIHDPVFDTIVRARFELPLQLGPASRPPDKAILGHLRVYISLRPPVDKTTEDLTVLISGIPTKSQVEPVDSTLNRLGVLLIKNPHALLNVLEDPEFSWIRQNESLVDSLRARIEDLISKAGAGGVTRGS